VHNTSDVKRSAYLTMTPLHDSTFHLGKMWDQIQITGEPINVIRPYTGTIVKGWGEISNEVKFNHSDDYIEPLNYATGMVK